MLWNGYTHDRVTHVIAVVPSASILFSSFSRHATGDQLVGSITHPYERKAAVIREYRCHLEVKLMYIYVCCYMLM